MPQYRRLRRFGGTYFFTLVSHMRRPLFTSALARRTLRESIAVVRAELPFTLHEIVLLPDHLHIVLTLPDGDSDFSKRLGEIKSTFTKSYLAAGGKEIAQSASRTRQGYRAIWQKRFWEHLVRDKNDLWECRKYCWYNPVKHGLAKCPHVWQWTTFHEAVKREWISDKWSCACAGAIDAPKLAEFPGVEMDE